MDSWISTYEIKHTSCYPAVTLVVMLDIKKKRIALVDTVLAKQEVASSQKVGHITEHFR